MSKKPYIETSENSDSKAAVNLIRQKIDSIYDSEPAAKAELKEVKETKKELSKHQKYMKELSESGKPLVDIQTKWHEYYQNLPDNEKHQVWQEFYSANAKKEEEKKVVVYPPQETKIHNQEQRTAKPKTTKTVADIKGHIKTRLKTTGSKKKLSKKDNFKSILFGLSMGGLAILVLLFGFFNERFIAPFITPSKNVSSTPIIIDPASPGDTDKPLAIVPKINVEVPVVYGVNSTAEKDIQTALEDGVVHYASTPKPGEQGNSVVVGHSSNNLFNSGQYKFAFVLLNRLEVDDTFSLTYEGKRYVYKVFDKKVVPPTDVSVLGPSERASTATLITCDPPGTSINRLIIVGEQISPDPASNTASPVHQASTEPQIVPGNAPSLWSRFTNWLTS